VDKREKNRIFYALFSTALFLILIWGIHLLVEYGGLTEWRRNGTHPRDLNRWWGVFTMPFLHGAGDGVFPDNFKHIANNTVSFAVLNTLLFYFYREVALKVWLSIALFSSLFVFVVGVEGSNHIGASGIVYGLAFFLFTAGALNMKHTVMVRVSLLVLFLYGSIIWGIFPVEESVSWEGHLGGALTGLFMAFILRKQLPEAPKPRWLLEEELENENKGNLGKSNLKSSGKTPVVSIYKQIRNRGYDRGF